MKTFVDSEAKETWEKYMEKHEAEDTLYKKSENIANTYIRWADHVGSKKGKFY
nr:1,3-beta-glucan synthase subunit FKS1-like, domain-1 [Tanacetum cinerariifolium]